jgi:hypothetical protein
LRRFDPVAGGHHCLVRSVRGGRAAKKESELTQQWEHSPPPTRWQYVIRVAGWNNSDGYFIVAENGDRMPLVEHIELLGGIGYELAGITPPRVLPAMAGGSELEELSLHESDYLLIFKRPVPG